VGHFLETYSYLVTALVLAAAAIAATHLWLSRPQRGTVWWMGLLMALSAPLTALLEGSYWRPPRLAGGTIGAEDVLISFAIGAIGWLLPLLFVRSRVALRPRPKVGWFLLLGLGPQALFLGLWALGGHPMTLLIAVQALLWPLLLAMRSELAPLSLLNGILFTALHTLLLRVYVTLWPEGIRHWNDASLWGRTLLDVPVGEIVWACGLGLGWPLAAGLIFDVRFVPGPAAGADAAPRRGSDASR
jgi:hypothetical protein